MIILCYLIYTEFHMIHKTLTTILLRNKKLVDRFVRSMEIIGRTCR